MIKLCAIIISAYNSAEYMKDLIESINNHLPVPGYEFETRIGVDGCQKTADKLISMNIPFYYSEKNVGSYIMRNSLIKIKPADVYAYFDADDVMKPEYLKRSLESDADAVMTGKINCDENLKPIKNVGVEYGGAITFSNKVLEAVGGFVGVRCAADSDFIDRVKNSGFDILEINEPLYLRRRHKNSLTKSSKTGIGSAYRKKVWSEMTALRNHGVIKIVPTVTELDVIG